MGKDRAAFLGRIYAFKFFDGFSLIYPLYAVMFVQHGLTPVQVSATLVAWSVTAFALQIPAGVLADRWPRRVLLACAQLARAVGFAVWILWPSFPGYLVGLMLWGVKSAFTNGTFEALVYDELAARDRQWDYARVVGRAQGINFASVLLASVGASAMMRFGYGAVIGASIVGGLAAGIAALSLPTTRRSLAVAPLNPLRHLREGFTFAVGHPVIPGLIGFMALTQMFGLALEAFWPVFGAEAGLTTAAVAIFVGAISASEATAAALAHRMRTAPRALFQAILLLNGALIALAAAVYRPWTVALVVVLCGLFKVIEVNFDARLHAVIPTESRATLASAKSFTVQVAMTLFLFGFGPLAQATSYRTAFISCGLLIVATATAYLAHGAWRRGAA